MTIKSDLKSWLEDTKAGRFVTIDGRVVFLGGPGAGGGGGGGAAGGGVSGQAAIDSGAVMGAAVGLLESNEWNIPYAQRSKDEISVGLAAEDSIGLQDAIDALGGQMAEVMDSLGVDAYMFIEAQGEDQAELSFEFMSRD